MHSELREATDDFDIYNEARGLRSRTRRWYTYQLERFASFVERNATAPHTIDQRTIMRFLAEERRNGRGDHTIRARYAALHAFFAWVEKFGYLGNLKQPVAKELKPSPPETEPRQTMLDDYTRLQASIKGDRWIDCRDRLLLAVLFRCGLRVGEAAALTMADLDLSRRRIKVRAATAKGKKDRLVPFSKDVNRLALEYFYNRPAHNDDVLWLADDGNGGTRGQLTAEGVRQMLLRRCKKAGLPYANPHSFRHGFAMEMLNAGADMSSVSTLLGHSSVAITEDTYAQWLIDPLQDEYDEVQERLNKKQRK